MLGIEPKSVVAAGQAKHLDADWVDQAAGTKDADDPIGRQQGFKESGHGSHSREGDAGIDNYRWRSTLEPGCGTVKPSADAGRLGRQCRLAKNLENRFAGA